MKRNRIVVLLAMICLTCALALVFASCKKDPIKFDVKFMVDGTAYDGNYWHYGNNGAVVIWSK